MDLQEKAAIALRALEEKDAEDMLEWMHDPNINKFFQFDAQNATKESALDFIQKSSEDKGKNIHFAIVDETDEYLGTISLKNIDWKAKTAEYAISTRKKAHGTGVTQIATYKLLKFAFETMGLERVYLNVLTDNKRAVSFYRKCGFIYEGEFRKHLFVKGKVRNLQWYSMLKEEYGENCKYFTGSDDREKYCCGCECADDERCIGK